MNSLFNDLACAWRQVLARPLFATLIVAVPALGIGATTAIFSLTDAVLFRPLPIHEPERVVRIFRVDETGRPNNNLTFPHITDLREHASSFSHISAYTDWAPFNLATPGHEPARVSGAVVTGDYFNLFGVPPLLGRYLLPGDDVERGGHPVTVLSERIWRSQFGADPRILGKTVHINTHPFTVVGVMPLRFGGADAQPSVDAWAPMAMMEVAAPFEQWSYLTNRNVSWLDGIVRLAPGVSLAAAQAEVDAITANVVEAEGLNIDNMRLGLLPATEAAVDPYSFEGTHRNAYLLLGVTAALLLLAMTNTASLLLVRTEERARELALRLGIGASRGMVLRMLLIEALAYALAGTALGIALAFWILSAALEPLSGMLSGAPTDPALLLHWRVLAFAGGLAVLTAVLSAVSPALRVMRLDINTSLKQGGSCGDRVSARTRGTFVATQVMLSVGLLTVALLLVRSFWYTAVVDPGFNPQRTLVAEMDLLRQGYSREDAQRAQDAILARVGSSPLVESAAFVRIVPVQSGGMFSTFNRPGQEQVEGMGTNVNMVTPSFFDTLRIPLLRGRGFTDLDTVDSERVIVINQHLADTWFAGEDPIGQRLAILGGEPMIVGITANTKIRSLREGGTSIAYAPLAQRPDAQASLVVRGHGEDPWALLPIVREAAHAVDPGLPLFRPRTLVDHIGNSYREATVMAWLLGAFAALAAVLSAAGLYGLLSWQVRARTREIGIRMSIGATAAAVRNQFLRRGFVLTAIGIPFGLLAAAWVARALDELLFGVTAADPLTLVAVTAGFLVAALFATWVPARRSARIDPMQALREE